MKKYRVVRIYHVFADNEEEAYKNIDAKKESKLMKSSISEIDKNDHMIDNQSQCIEGLLYEFEESKKRIDELARELNR